MDVADLILTIMITILFTSIGIMIILLIYDHMVNGEKLKKIDFNKYKSKNVVILTDDRELIDIKSEQFTTIEVQSLKLSKNNKFIIWNLKWIHVRNIIDIDEVT